MSKKHYAPCPSGCRGKVKYTKEDAARIAAALEALDGDKMDSYPCRFGGWHVGHANPRQARLRRKINANREKAQKGTLRSIIGSGPPVPSNRGKRRNGKYGNRKQQAYWRERDERDERDWKRINARGEWDQYDN